MLRKNFILNQGATCKNWTWSWSFVNHREKFVIFGAWQVKTHKYRNRHLILDSQWETRIPKGSNRERRQPGYGQAIEHLDLVKDEGYALFTFPIWLKPKTKPGEELDPSSIWYFEPELTPKSLLCAKGKWWAVDFSGTALQSVSDAQDDLDPANGIGLGRDGGDAKVGGARKYFPRNPEVRLKVLELANGKCERDGCGQRSKFKGFLDVHHILGIATSDRVKNCVALCPNCHREAHFSPRREELNKALLLHAENRQRARLKP